MEQNQFRLGKAVPVANNEFFFLAYNFIIALGARLEVIVVFVTTLGRLRMNQLIMH